MKYLVCRKDGIKTRGGTSTINNSCFPILVETFGSGYSPEEIVRMAMNSIREGYVGMHDYLVIPLTAAAAVVSFKPRPSYDVTVRQYNG